MDLRHSTLWFFTVGGVILLVSGVLQALVRPRGPREHRFINRGMLRTLVFVAVGVTAILVGQGVVSLGGR